MAAYITPGEVFDSSTLGKVVTAARLNNHVAGATIETEFITDQTAETSVTPSTDYLIYYDASSDDFRKVLLSDFFASQTADAAVSVASLRSLGFTGTKAAPGAGTPALSSTNTFTGVTNRFKHIAGTAGAVVSALSAVISGTVSVDANANDMMGNLTFTVVSVLANTDLARVTFTDAFAAVPHVALVPFDNGAVVQQQGSKYFSITSVSTSAFVVHTGSVAPNPGTYVYVYMVAG